MMALRRLLMPRLGLSNKSFKAPSRHEDSLPSMSSNMGKVPAIFNTPMPYTMAF